MIVTPLPSCERPRKAGRKPPLPGQAEELRAWHWQDFGPASKEFEGVVTDSSPGCALEHGHPFGWSLAGLGKPRLLILRPGRKHWPACFPPSLLGSAERWEPIPRVSQERREWEARAVPPQVSKNAWGWNSPWKVAMTIFCTCSRQGMILGQGAADLLIAY